jgi:hypothetical protein
MRNAIFAIVAVVFALACGGEPKTAGSGSYAGERAFSTPAEASDALIQAASTDDLTALLSILGPDGRDLVASKDPVQDRQRAENFAAKAREKWRVEKDPNNHARATLVVGADDWPLPIPIVLSDGKWYFDSKAGRDELLRRRIGANELDVISICRGYVAAQKQYASQIHDDSGVNQYAQRIVSQKGKHDGLAWRNADGTWGGPVGPSVARAIEEGYSEKMPFHGYYFKVLEGQGPSARLGTLDYKVGDAMIGGFALVAWPTEYGVTGIQTFIVSYDGVVYQKDLGPQTQAVAASMLRYDPDTTWRPTDDAP